MYMLKEDRNGYYVVVSRVNGEVRKYADHRFRAYEEGAGWDSEPTSVMTWGQLPVYLQNRGEAYDIVCSDATDPTEPELREYQRNVLYQRDNTIVIRQVQHWESGFSQFEIWRKEEEDDSFDKKKRVYSHMTLEQVGKLKEFWNSKQDAWDRRYDKRMASKEWHEKWVGDNMSLTTWMLTNKRAQLLCERLLCI